MAKQVTFYYVRHGETEFNRDGIVQGGHVDAPLVPESIPTIEATGHALSRIVFAHCWCSPLERAYATARIVRESAGQPKLDIQPVENLREFNFGTLEGQTHQNHRGDFARGFLHQDFSAYGGETGANVRERARRAFHKMYKASQDGDSVLVVGHGSYLRYVLLEFSRLSGPSRWVASRTMRVPNASVSVIVGKDGEFEFRHMPMTAAEFDREWNEGVW